VKQAFIQDKDNFPMVVIANKADGGLSKNTGKRVQQLIASEANPIPHFEASALDGLYVDQAILTVAKLALEKRLKEHETKVEPGLAETDEPFLVTPANSINDHPPSKCCK